MTKPEDNSPRLDERLARLSAEIPPARDLWPEIAAQIRHGEQPRHARPRRYSWRFVAAAASVTLVAVFAATLYRGDDAPLPQVGPVGPVAPVASTFGPGHVLGSEYQAARAGLADDLERRLQALPPETRDSVLENLATIRRAADEINAALGSDPANVLLQNQLLAAYQDELTVLANLQRVTERLPMRNEI
jgi:hypothetical protein